MLDKLFSRLSKEFDWAQNKVKNGVKYGGRMTTGEYYIDVYLSYKSQDNKCAYFALIQPQSDDELLINVGTYQTHCGENSGVRDELEGGIDSFDELVKVFENHLGNLIK